MDIEAEEVVAARRKAKEEQDSVAEAGADAATIEPAEIVGNKQSKTYYPGSCQPAKDIAEANKVIFKTTADAEKAGFKLGKNCH